MLQIRHKSSTAPDPEEGGPPLEGILRWESNMCTRDSCTKRLNEMYPIFLIGPRAKYMPNFMWLGGRHMYSPKLQRLGLAGRKILNIFQVICCFLAENLVLVKLLIISIENELEAFPIKIYWMKPDILLVPRYNSWQKVPRD